MKSDFLFLSKWRNLLFLFGLSIIANFLLGQYMPKDQALDLMFAYSVDEAYSAINQLDLVQRNSYRFGLLALDMPYLVIYGLFFSGLLIKLWKRKFMVWIPISIVVMDFFENLMVLRMLYIFPERQETLAILASVFTTGKWIFVGILAFALIAGLLSIALPRLFSKASL